MIVEGINTFDIAVNKAKQYFPNLTIKYKDESFLMKVLDKLTFFNASFMAYSTTIGSTIYFPSRHLIDLSPQASNTRLMHELSHMYNSKKKTGIIFSILYLFPQILALLSVPVFFIFGLFKALLCLLFLLPLPSYTRMMEEKQAYIISLYSMHKLNKHGFSINLDTEKDRFIEDFSGPTYYFMWYLPGLKASMDADLEQIKLDGKPTYDAALYSMVDSILEG
jgi:hypothetical protein